MYNPTTRLLTILELLQSRGEMSGQEIARMLEVEERSVRRYIMLLRDIGIPVDGERGRYGGYRLRPGFRLPPLMFNADEINAVMLGLLLLREFRYGSLTALESASAKIDRVLPEDLRQRMEAVRQSLLLNHVQLGTHHLSNEHISLFSLAIYDRHCLDIQYASADGEVTQRVIAPYGLVLHSRTWYIPAYCYLREETRLFRLDRIRAAVPTDRHFEMPADFDAAAFIFERLARIPGLFTFEVIVHAPLATVREVIPPDTAQVEALGEDTLVTCYSDDPHWFARYLASIELPFTVHQPDALREALQTVAEKLVMAARR
ncbi:MAG: YafY family transcriptional regulator [Anaerolineae bacterium]|nr:YafY family transcriptional regulator [Anaerolineae bacterium]